MGAHAEQGTEDSQGGCSIRTGGLGVGPAGMVLDSAAPASAAGVALRQPVVGMPQVR